MNRTTQRARRVFLTLGLAIAASLCASTAQAQTFVQVNSAIPDSATQLNVSYLNAQASGDLNVVIVGWNDSTAVAQSVTDTMGNTYVLATGPVKVSGALTQSIYYAKNIVAAAAGANVVQVTFNTSAISPDIRILEYSGVDTNNPFDGGTGATGTATTTDSGALTTTNAKDLLVGANIVLTSTASAGSGYTKRVITYPDGDLAEDRDVTVTGAYHATAKLNAAGKWIMQIVAFKAAGSTPSPTAPGNLAASPVSSSQINLSWAASTETGGTIASYLIERCQGTGCSNFAQISTSTTTSFNDTGLTASTSYSYRVRAKDSNGNTGPYSNTASATTQAAVIPTPTAPGNLAALAGPSGPFVVATQEYLNATALTAHTTSAFNSTGGDVIVVAASSHAGVTMTPTDNLGNLWTSIAGPTSTTVGADLRTELWYARNANVGAGHTITLTLSAAEPLVISVIVARGSNVGGPIDAVSAIGSDGGTASVNVASPNITTTAAYDLLLGFAKSSQSETWLAGTGFVAQPGASSTFLFAETGLATTPGSYDATASIQGNDTWQAAVAAVSPSTAATNPEQVNLSWTASTETGGTVASYLVERCVGSGCSTFTQIGTTAYLWYTDTTVSASTSYSYRVRAVDTANNTGPYSNVVTATTPASGSATPSISGISPSSGSVGTSVTISGANFGATQGTSTVSFGGATGTPTSWSASSIVVPVPAGANTGSVIVTVGGQTSNALTFTVTVPAPVVSSLNPTSGTVGTSVTISGANFGAAQGTSTVSFSGTAAAPTSWSATSIVAPVPTGATSGSVVVTVSGQASNGLTFTVPAPSISSLNPASGAVGTSVTISGANFGATQGTSTVSFNGTTATPTSWSVSSIVVPVPTGTTSGSVVVTVGGQTSNSLTFTVTVPAPVITSLNPNSGVVGTSVTINGTNFGATQGTSAVSFGGVAATPTSWSASSIVVPVPTGATSGNVVVTVAGQASNGLAFTVTVPAPSISSLSPNSGPAGTSVTVTGTNFGTSQGTSTVVFDGVAATPTSWSATSIVVPVPAGAPNGPVVVTVGGIASNGIYFTVNPPNISSLNPTAGPVGSSVTIAGTNFGLTTGTVTFNGTVAAPTMWSNTSITVPVPSGATTGNVVVTANSVASNGMAFTVLIPPSITSLSPTAGPFGTTVTITGANFGATQGSSSVTFGGALATATSWSATSIVVTVPAGGASAGGASTGPVIVTVNGVASNGINFTVNPSILSLSPVDGPIGSSVTIQGQNFGSAQGSSSVSFNGIVATPTSWSPGIVNVPVPSGATTGNIVVTVGGLASNGVLFTVTPTIANLSSNFAPVGAAITITGTGFGATQGTSTVTFGATIATPTSWSSTSIVVPVPPSSFSGIEFVSVTVGGLSSNGFNLSVTPAISALNPTSGPFGTSVTITGTSFGTPQGSSTVSFNGVAATPTSWSPTSVVVPVPNGATTGNVVVTSGGSASNGFPFTVTSPGPSITSLSVVSAPVGTAVTLSGANFGATQGTSTVTFNGTAATPTSWSTTSIVVPVPTGATTGNVVVTVGGIPSNSIPFTVLPTPIIAGVNPSSGQIGTAVTITGTNFGATQGLSTLTFSGIAASVTSWSNTSITAVVPTTLTGNVVVTVAGVASNGSNFTVLPPTITSINPTAGPVGTSVTITGTGFGTLGNVGQVNFSGAGAYASPISWSPTSVVVSVPATATTGNVVLVVLGMFSNDLNFTVTPPPPSISVLSPNSGPIGTSVTIAGANFGATQGTSTVSFNGVPATPTSWSATSIAVPVPAGATTGNVVVTVGGQVSNGLAFTVTPPAPGITSLNPSSGPVGTSVTISGANFGATQGASTVKFNLTTATPTSWSASSIVVPVPTGATTGNVILVVGGQTSNGVAFTVTSGSSSPTAPGNLTAVASSLAPAVISEQGYINTAFQTAHTTQGFDSTGGDLLVLFTSSHAGVTFTPSDSFGNTWISIAGPTSTSVGFDLRSQMWYARNPIVGPNHTVTMGLSAANSLVMSVLVIKGSNKSSPLDGVSAIGSDNGSESVNIASPSITTLAANDLLVGFSKVSSGSTFQPGTGFVQQTAASSNYLDAEAGLAATPAVYSATFTIDGPETWQAVVAAVSPVPASNPNLVNLSWSASTESGGTISSYLVERCLGSGCSNFAQIGTSPTTTYSDTTVTASTTYIYRVRAQDGTGNLGPYSNTATVTTPSGVPLPSITNLSPSSGTAGTSVTISGANFGATQGSSAVSFNGVLATPTSWSASSIVAPVPAGATSGNVTVVVGGQTSNGLPFTVTLPPPAITALSPAFGPVGTSVTINGANFGAAQGSSTLSFNGTLGTPTSWSASSIVVPVPTGATTGNLTVTVGGQISNAALFTVGTTPPPGTITHVQQASNSDVTGRSFSSFSVTLPAATTTGDAIVIGLTYGNANTPITATDSLGNTYTQAIATYDAGHNQGCTILYATGIKGNGLDTVTLNFTSQLAFLGVGVHEYSGVAGLSALDGTTGSQAFSGSPSTGSITTKANGDLIFSCITEDAIGSGINFTPGSGFTKRVDLGQTAAYADEDGVQAIAGPIAATWTMSPSSQWVTNMAAFKSVNGAAAPSIASLSPTSGAGDTAVTITGTNFGATQGTSTVTFNGTTATPTSWTATSIVVPVPAGATTGNVVINVSGLASNGVSFTVTP